MCAIKQSVSNERFQSYFFKLENVVVPAFKTLQILFVRIAPARFFFLLIFHRLIFFLQRVIGWNGGNTDQVVLLIWQQTADAWAMKTKRVTTTELKANIVLVSVETTFLLFLFKLLKDCIMLKVRRTRVKIF